MRKLWSMIHGENKTLVLAGIVQPEVYVVLMTETVGTRLHLAQYNRSCAQHMSCSFSSLYYISVAEARPVDPFLPAKQDRTKHYILVPRPLILTTLYIAQVLGRGYKAGSM